MAHFYWRALFLSIIPAFLVGVVLSVSVAHAQSSVMPAGISAVPHPATMVATVNIQDATFTNDQGILHIKFDISNRVGEQHNVLYAVQLIAQNQGKQFIADQKVFDEQLTLTENSVLHKDISYITPSGLKGTYSVVLLSKNTSGFPLAISKIGTVTLDGQSGVGIVADTCYLQVQGESSGKKYSLREGVDIAADEVIRAVCTVQNFGKTPVVVVPKYETHLRTTFGEIVPQTGGSPEEISLEGSEHKVMTINLPKANKPQAYDVRIALSGQGFLSNTIVAHYVLRGESATIQTLSMNHDSYSLGQSAEINFMWSTSADGFPGARAVGTYSASTYVAELKDGSGTACAATLVGKLPDSQMHVVLPITHGCSSPHVTITLKDPAGVVLAQKDLQLTSKATAPSQLILWGVLVFLILLGLILFFLWNAGKLNLRALFPLFFFAALLLPSAVPLHQAHADTFCTAGLHEYRDSNGVLSEWSDPCLYYYNVNYDKSSYAANETVNTTAQVQTAMCDNEIIQGSNSNWSQLVGASNYSSETYTLLSGAPAGETLSDYDATYQQCQTLDACYGDPLFGSAAYTAPASAGTYSVRFTGTGKYLNSSYVAQYDAAYIDKSFTVSTSATNPNTVAGPQPYGKLEALDCSTFTAWGFDPDTPSTASTLNFSMSGSTVTIGETNVLSIDDPGMDNGIYAQSTSLSQAGTIQSLSLYVSVAVGTLRLGIYDATGPGGGPGNKLAETAEFTPSTGWNTANVVSPASLAAGTYWLAYWTSSASLATRRVDSVGSISYYPYTNSPMPDVWSTTPWTGSQHWSFYGTLSTGQVTTFSPNVVRNDINTTYGITGTHGFSYAVPSFLNDGIAHTVNILLNDTAGGAPTDITNGGVSMLCGANLPAVTVSSKGCTLSGGSCPMYVYWTGVNTNSSKVDVLQIAPDGTQTQYLGQAASSGTASTTLGVTANQWGTYTFKIYDYNQAFAASSFLGTTNATVNSPPILTCNSGNACTMDAGKNVQLAWSCSPLPTDTSSSGNFPTGSALSGSVLVSPATTQSYTLQCNPSGSQANTTVTVLFPALSMSITPNPTRKNNTSTLKWSAANADSCTMTGPGVSVNSLTGSTNIAVTSRSTYTLLCQTGIGATSTSKTVYVTPTVKEQ